MNRLEIILRFREFLMRNDVKGALEWLDTIEPVIRASIESARASRSRLLARSIKPVSISENPEDSSQRIVCFDERDLYWVFSRVSLRRLGLES